MRVGTLSRLLILLGFVIIIDSLDSSIQAAELDYKVAVEETALVALQQDQSRLFTKLELALADHQVAIEKVTIDLKA